MDTRIVWFRRDLRLSDHPALAAALTRPGPDGDPPGEDLRVVPLFVIDPAIVARGRVSPARLRYLADALADLDERLRARGGRLVVRHGEPVAALHEVVDEVRATQLHHTADVTPYALARDQRVREELGSQGVVVEAHPGLYVHDPGSVTTNDGDMYKVFTPFHRSWRDLDLRDVLAPPEQVPVHGSVRSDDVPGVDDLLEMAALTDGPDDPAPALDPALLPRGGESAARARLDGWLDGDVDAYDDLRDDLAADATSRLSADLHYGCLSVAEIIDRVDRRNPGQKAFATEIAWRDFYAHVLARWPEVLVTAFNSDYRSLPWQTGGEEYDAWRAGRTGYPVVDAAMRQLARSGWMHNRARMITASFLTKDLRVHWRSGEDHFLAHLVDGDLASNNGGWQWAAGTGTDAQPYFRIFNPVTQGEKFDPDGVYIRRWLPELADVRDEHIHEPWRMNDEQQAQCGVHLGDDYPWPMVDHKQARQETLAWFSEHRGG